MLCLDEGVEIREWIWDDLKGKCKESLGVWIKVNRVKSEGKFMKVCEWCDRYDWNYIFFNW